MNAREILAYYSREDVQKALLKASEKREVVGVFKDGAFSKRPSTLIYPQDIVSQVRGGAVAFHCSLERWQNPMAVGSDGYESGRTGWDLVLDIDVEDTEHGKVAAAVFLDALRRHGIGHASVKFTGGTGFHIGIPWEAFPQTIDYSSTSAQYPELARRIVQYLKHHCAGDLEKALLKHWSVEQLSEQTGKPVGSILTKDGIDPYKVADVDPVLISPRHLYRMPFSLHEKKHLVSLPIRLEDLAGFRKEDAEPADARFAAGFLDEAEEDEAASLVIEAVDWYVRQKRKRESAARRDADPQTAVPLELAPPCVKAILEGLADGRKRSLFILINYLSSLKWEWDAVESLLLSWNNKNRPPMPETYIRGQVRWHRNRKALPPPNCDNEGYCQSIGVCRPDELCGGQKKIIKNPINYAVRKLGKK